MNRTQIVNYGAGVQFVTHIDINATKNMYTPDVIKVTKMFHTVQGEAPFVGWPCLFVRLAGCNRGAKIGYDCPWCDTAFELDQATDYAVDDLADNVVTELESYVHDPMIVITGGEPLLQTPALIRFLTSLATKRSGIMVQFETNGDFSPFGLILGLKADILERLKLRFVVSPKGPADRKNMWFMSSVTDTNRSILYAGVQCFMRRVVSTEGDYVDINPEWLNSPWLSHIYLSPMMVYQPTETPDDPIIDYPKSIENSKHAFSLMKKYNHNVRLSFQSHVFMAIE